MNANKWNNTETILSYSQKFDLMQQFLEEKFKAQNSPKSSSLKKQEHKNKDPSEQLVPTPMNFKAEIQRRFDASSTNRAYKFPRNLSLSTSSCDQSFDSIKHITIYELKTQNRVVHTKTPSQNDYKSIREKQPFADSNKRLTTEPGNNEFFLAKNPISTNILNRSELNAKEKFEELLKEKSPKDSSSQNKESNQQTNQISATFKGKLAQSQPIKHVQVSVQNPVILANQDYKKIDVKLNSQQPHQSLKPKYTANQQRTKLISSTASNNTHCMSYQQSLHSNSKLQEKTINSQMMKQEISRHSKLPSDGEKILLSEYLRTGNEDDKLNISSNAKKLLQYSTMAEYANLKEKARKISSNNQKPLSQNKTSSTNIQELLRNTQTDLLTKKQQNQNIVNQNLYKKLKGNLLKTQLQNLNQLEEPSSTCFQDLTNADLVSSKPNNNNTKSKINITNNENAQSPSNSISFQARNQLKYSNDRNTKTKEKSFVSPLNSVIPAAQNTSKNFGTKGNENRNLSRNQQSIYKTSEQLEQSRISIQQQSQINKSTLQPKKISSAKITNNNDPKHQHSQKRSLNLKQQQEKIFSMKQQQVKQSAHTSQLQNSTLNSHISPQKLQISNQAKSSQLSQQQQKCKKIYSIEKIKVNLKQETNKRTEACHYQKHSLLNNYFQEKSLIQQPHNILETQFQSNNLISPSGAHQQQQHQPQNTSAIDHNMQKKNYQKGKKLSSYQNQFQDIKSLKMYQNINQLLRENGNMATTNLLKL